MIEFKSSYPSNGHFKTNINSAYFDVWSPRMAWCLGLMFTDGNIYSELGTDDTNYRKKVKIDNTDLEILKKFTSYVCPGKEICSYNYGRGKGIIYTVSFHNKDLFNSLVSRGLSERKSLTSEFNSTYPKDIMSSFIRGLWDGDGSICNIDGKFLVIFVSGSEKFIIGLDDFLIVELHLSKHCISFGNGVYSIRLYGKNAIKLCRYIYDDKMDDAFLTRKYKVWLDYKKERCL